jgi:hypothetical protein
MCQPTSKFEANRGCSRRARALLYETLMRARLSAWQANLAVTLGLVVACGGKATERGDEADGGSGDTGEGGSAGSAGASTGGGPRGGNGGSGAVTTGGSDLGGAPTFGGSGGMAPGGAGGNGGSYVDANCTNPTPFDGGTGEPTGFVACNEGFIHRPERRDCASRVPRDERVAEAVGGKFVCATDGDCASVSAYGYCEAYSVIYPPESGTRCVTGCVRDADCAQGSVCLCGDPVGRCVAASCGTDADCDDGVLCTSSFGIVNPCTASPTPSPFACQSPTDRCRSALDCGTFPASCLPKEGGRACVTAGVCGRPFLVAGEARLAPLCEQGCGWASARLPTLAPLDARARAAVARHWSRNALMEHASVAAFARFVLELLALGAPAELVRDAQRALGDEIEHAEICFALASAHAGEVLGPGKLSPEGALGRMSLVDVVETAILEGCIGETLAAVEALAAAQYATDDAARSALTRIAEDERRHAELGFRFVRWALEAADVATNARLQRLLAESVARAVDAERALGSDLRREATSDAGSTRDLLAHGVLTPVLGHRARLQALELVVEPLARSLVRNAGRATGSLRRTGRAA